MNHNGVHSVKKDLGLYNPAIFDCVDFSEVEGGIGTGITCFLANSCFTLIGIVASFSSKTLRDCICPSLKDRTELSSTLLISSGKILSDSYKCFLRVLNPSAAFGFHKDLFPKSSSDPDDENLNLPGLFWEMITPTITCKIQEYTKENDVFYHHVMSRVMSVLFVLTSVVIRSVDLCIGLIASVFSLCTLGTNTKFNTAAVLGLQGTGVVRDIVAGLHLVIDPSLFL